MQQLEAGNSGKSTVWHNDWGPHAAMVGTVRRCQLQWVLPSEYLSCLCPSEETVPKLPGTCHVQLSDSDFFRPVD